VCVCVDVCLHAKILLLCKETAAAAAWGGAVDGLYAHSYPVPLVSLSPPPTL
jgi:hypothetical protein